MPVTVHELALTAFDPPDARLHVRCSSGTYVRSLARDLGEALGVGAHLTELRRTAVGTFPVEDALSPDELSDEARVAEAWIDPLRALSHLPCVEVDDGAAADLGHGRAVPVDGIDDGGPAAAAHEGTLVAVGEVRDATFRPRRVFAHG